MYPEPEKFGVLPAYGFFIRHVKNIQLNNVEVSYLGKETRSAIILDDVKGVELNRVKVQTVKNRPSIILKNVSDFSSKGSSPIEDISIKNVKDKSF
jgi:hypothetical protein